MSAINITKNNFQEEVMNAKQSVLLDFWAPVLRRKFWKCIEGGIEMRYTNIKNIGGIFAYRGKVEK